MLKIASWFIAIAGWIAGQIMIFSGSVMPGTVVIIFATFTGLAAYFRVWETDKSGPGAEMFGIGAPGILAAMAIISAITGMMFVKASPNSGTALFILSGGLLFLARPSGEKLLDFSEISSSAGKMLKWEPWFVVVLILISGFLRMYDTGNIPQVGYGSEGLMMGACDALAAKGAKYTPHISLGTDWPTFTYYLGILFAKIFGWDIASFRASSGLLATLSIIAFYFLARRLTSPLPAAMTSLMYTVFLPHLTISRAFEGPATLMFIPQVICLGILLAAAGRPKWYLYLAAGLAGGYSLHGYVPGRGVFVLFLAWFIMMLVTRKKIFHKASNCVLFWIGFIAVSSPVVYYAIKEPNQYWGYVNSVNPSRGGGIAAYVKQILTNLHLYAGMFYTKSAWETMNHVPYKPLFDAVTGVFFSMGFFLCLFAFWKPLPSILLILFIGGLVPGLLGGGSTIQPNAGRALLSFPVIFLFCAFGFERLRKIYRSAGNRHIYIIVIIAGISASLWSFQEGFRGYFRFAKSPVLLVNQAHYLYIMNREMKKHPDAETYLTPFFDTSDARSVFLPPGKKINYGKNMGKLLVLKPRTDCLVMLPPFYSNALGIFKECFPNADIKTYREPKERENDPFYTETQIYTGGKRHTDRFEPYIFLNSIFIPAADVRDFQTMLYEISGDSKTRVKVFEGSDFGEKHAGRKVVLRGAVLIPEIGSNDINNPEPIIFSLAWKGWKLTFHGKEQGFGRTITLGSGVHYFELAGTVPAGVSGDLPFKVMHGQKNLVEEGRVVAIGEVFGVRAYHTPGEKSWDKPYTYTRRLLVPNFRLYDGIFMQMPFSITEKAMLKVPETGEYEIKANKYNSFKITVDDKVVYDNIDDPAAVKSEKIFLYKDRPVKIILQMSVVNNSIETRALTLYIKGPGMADFVMAPYDWFYRID